MTTTACIFFRIKLIAGQDPSCQFRSNGDLYQSISCIRQPVRAGYLRHEAVKEALCSGLQCVGIISIYAL